MGNEFKAHIPWCCSNILRKASNLPESINGDCAWMKTLHQFMESGSACRDSIVKEIFTTADSQFFRISLRSASKSVYQWKRVCIPIFELILNDSDAKFWEVYHEILVKLWSQMEQKMKSGQRDLNFSETETAFFCHLFLINHFATESRLATDLKKKFLSLFCCIMSSFKSYGSSNAFLLLSILSHVVKSQVFSQYFPLSFRYITRLCLIDVSSAKRARCRLKSYLCH